MGTVGVVGVVGVVGSGFVVVGLLEHESADH